MESLLLQLRVFKLKFRTTAIGHHGTKYPPKCYKPLEYSDAAN
jgi:hypothetical protein